MLKFQFIRKYTKKILDMIQVLYILINVNGIVGVITSDPPYKYGNARCTMLPLIPLSGQ